MPFQPGQSGNPAGRPRGSRNKRTLLVEAVARAAGEALAGKAVELAREGNSQALRACLSRLVPVPRSRPVDFELPPIRGHEDAVKAANALLAAVSDGELTPVEATELMRLINAHPRRHRR
jgi:hypothetical protein